VHAERTRLESRLAAIRNRMGVAYADELDDTITEDFWERMAKDWRMEQRSRSQSKALKPLIPTSSPRRSENFRTRQ
jgi:hypothetical protein